MGKRILYIGNKLSDKNRNLTTVEILSGKLQELDYQVKSYSDQSNKIFRLCSMLFAIIRHRSYDYVLIDTYSTSAFWFAWSSARLCRLLNIKYIMILHGGSLPNRLKTREKASKAIFSKALFNITPSDYLFEKFQNAGYSNLNKIPNHIEIENYPFKPRFPVQPNLLWVRAFADIYNPLLALKVLKEVLKKYPEAQLSMVGPFKDQSINDCKRYAKDNQLPVKFTGRLSREDWIKYSKKFDIFINTTNVDNTPVSVIEAMALGLPVVSTNVGGIPYLLKNNENALLVSADKESEMSEAIIDLIENPYMSKKLTKAARQKVEEFNWNVVKHLWQDALK